MAGLAAARHLTARAASTRMMSQPIFRGSPRMTSYGEGSESPRGPAPSRRYRRPRSRPRQDAVLRACCEVTQSGRSGNSTTNPPHGFRKWRRNTRASALPARKKVGRRGAGQANPGGPRQAGTGQPAWPLVYGTSRDSVSRTPEDFLDDRANRARRSQNFRRPCGDRRAAVGAPGQFAHYPPQRLNRESKAMTLMGRTSAAGAMLGLAIAVCSAATAQGVDLSGSGASAANDRRRAFMSFAQICDLKQIGDQLAGPCRGPNRRLLRVGVVNGGNID